MEEISAKLKTESQLLQLTRGKTKAVVEKGNLEKILRHKEALGKVVSSLEELKLQAEKAKLAAGESVEDVEKWGAEIEQKVDEADDDIVYLGRCLEEAATRAENEKREKDNILLARQREEELKFLQVLIRAEDQEALRFHWLDAKDPQRVCTLRSTWDHHHSC